MSDLRAAEVPAAPMVGATAGWSGLTTPLAVASDASSPSTRRSTPLAGA